MKIYKRQLALLACLVFFNSCSKEERLFSELEDARREPETARTIATELSKTPEGVELAIADMSIFGGKTRGWSSWILTNSDLNTLVEGRLKKIAGDLSLATEKRLEAANILWYRTQDVSYLEVVFVMVQPAGNLETEWGRRALSTAIAPEDIANAITVPASEPISLSLEKFKQLLRDPRNLRIPTQER